MGMSYGMLIAHVKNRNVAGALKYEFARQRNLNYAELDKDVTELETTAQVMRQA